VVFEHTLKQDICPLSGQISIMFKGRASGPPLKTKVQTMNTMTEQGSLQENLCLSCVKIFVVCFILGARQRACFPCVFYSAPQSIFIPLCIPNKPNVILLKILCRAH
jgi:hypothetical protein